MLSDRIKILNFDNSLLAQKRLLDAYRPEILDFTSIGPAARLWASRKTAEAISSALAAPCQCVTFLGSGDFHHISYLLLRAIREPVTLILFDLHPDWDILPPKLGCGSWVSRAVELPYVRKTILLGPASEDLSAPAIYTGNLQALKNDRLEIYPYEHGPTRVYFRNVPHNSSLRIQRSGPAADISWTGLRGKGCAATVQELLRRCLTRKAYISIDKDCLRPEHALTNWEPGRLSLEELLAMISCIKADMDIIGADITGDYSEPVFSSRFKSLCSRLDHPARPSALGKPAGEIHAVNEQTNLQLIEALLS